MVFRGRADPGGHGRASQFKLIVYDAAYLELAQRRRLPLASLDQDLRNAATASGLEILGIAGE